MNVKCSYCNHKFPISEDDVLFNYDVDYNNFEKYVWENLPLMKSKFQIVPENLENN